MNKLFKAFTKQVDLEAWEEELTNKLNILTWIGVFDVVVSLVLFYGRLKLFKHDLIWGTINIEKTRARGAGFIIYILDIVKHKPFVIPD